jgi:hypothetical protein
MMAKISQFAHTEIRDEIRARRESGERPIPTMESVIDEMVRQRIKRHPRPQEAAEELRRARVVTIENYERTPHRAADSTF